MGVRLTRTIDVARGKGDEASKFAADVCDYLNEHHGLGLIWGLEIGGTVGRIHWFSDYESLTALEASFGAAAVDEGYNKLLDRGTDLFVGLPHDTWVYIQ